MTQAELNHLRRLVAWVRCEYFFEPDEYVNLAREHMAMGIGPSDDDAKQRMVEYHDKLRQCPKYVHAAVKSLSKYLTDHGPVVDAVEAPRKIARKQSEAA